MVRIRMGRWLMPRGRRGREMEGRLGSESVDGEVKRRLGQSSG